MNKYSLNCDATGYHGMCVDLDGDWYSVEDVDNLIEKGIQFLEDKNKQITNLETELKQQIEANQGVHQLVVRGMFTVEEVAEIANVLNDVRFRGYPTTVIIDAINSLKEKE